MRIALLGGAGNLGRRVIDVALARGHEVLVVSPHAGDAALDPRATSVTASDAMPELLLETLRGIDAVGILFPADLREPHTYPARIDTVLTACATAGVARIVGVVGSAGALTSHGVRLVDTDYFQETTRHFYESVHDAWAVYRRHPELDWVAVVPAARMQLHLADRGVYRRRTDEQLVTSDDTSWRFFDVSLISYGDCALAVVDEIDDRTRAHCFVTVGY